MHTLFLALISAAVAQPAGIKDIPAIDPAHGRGYYRMPAIHNDTIVFVAEGDLWRVSNAGGVASRLTTAAGDEEQPAISPDGKALAFLAEYEGPGEVYTMPLEGGLPTRRTHGASRVSFIGWTAAEPARVMYSTRQFADLPSSQLATIDLATNVVTRVPLAEADEGVEDGAGTLYFTRMPFQGSFTKRYKGGFIQQLWSFKTGAAEAVALTVDYEGTSRNPMWWNGRVYFASDRDGVMNIWSMTPDGKDLEQHTKHADLDVAAPAMSEGKVVYQHGADLWLLDTSSNQTRELDIRLASDFDQLRENWIEKPFESISDVALSPDGSRVAITARGKVFVAPAKQGRIVEVTRTSGERWRGARFLSPGDKVFAMSDASGEVEFYSLPANGVGESKQLTNDGTMLRWEGVPSPDGKWLAHHDKAQTLYLTNLETKETTKIAQSPIENFGGLEWSDDSAWLAFVEPAGNTYQQVKAVNAQTKQLIPVTTDRYDSYSPSFSPDGKWLYFLSDRVLKSGVPSVWGPLQPEPHFDKRTKVYAVALQKNLRSPWQPDDELKDKKEEAKEEEKTGEKPETDAEKKDDAKTGEDAKDDKAEKKDEKKKGAPAKVEIDVDGLATRLIETPIAAGNYNSLTVTDKAVFFMSRDAGDEKGNLVGVTITNEKLEPKTVAKGLDSYEISADRKKFLLRKSDALFVIDANVSEAKLDDAKVDLSKWSLSVVPADEWRQMYVDAWRLLRDYFYADNLHGVDWAAVRAKYAPLVARVRSRVELNDLIAQMTGELSTLHHFVRGGDIREGTDQIPVASLGASLERDDAAGGWKVADIPDFDPDEPSAYPPLAKHGVEVREGDVIAAINGVPTLSVPDPMVILRGKAGQQVLLTVYPRGDKAAVRDAIATPIDANAAANLRYNAWEYSRRVRVEQASNGDIGYVHLRAMGTDDIAQFARDYYPVFNRKGLIIDVRRNRGGNIDSWVLSRLMRRAWMYWNQRVGRAPSWNMQWAFRGHMVVLCDGWTASDGEAFSEGFKRLGLGKVIGTRTWGGEVWLSSSNFLVDRGIASAGEYGVFGPEGAWLVEGRGVEPDITVDNPPHATFKGQDAQLDAAIAHLKQRILEQPVELPPVPARPDKSFRREK
ncbi:MAG TPA: S41 family peptidase [Phycisphaerales bacterium]|nr:S41 family peptidase [Phycisphaerales bacterium]